MVGRVSQASQVWADGFSLGRSSVRGGVAEGGRIALVWEEGGEVQGSGERVGGVVCLGAEGSEWMHAGSGGRG